jgi:hypothetical protein
MRSASSTLQLETFAKLHKTSNYVMPVKSYQAFAIQANRAVFRLIGDHALQCPPLAGVGGGCYCRRKVGSSKLQIGIFLSTSVTA